MKFYDKNGKVHKNPIAALIADLTITVKQKRAARVASADLQKLIDEDDLGIDEEE